MQSERVERFERRSRRWFRAAATPVADDQPLDERSMRVLEILVAGLVLGVATLLSLVQTPATTSLGVVGMLVLGSVLFVVALVSLIR